MLQHETFQGPNICNVWVYNFEHELARISELLENYPIVAMVSNVISIRVKALVDQSEVVIDLGLV